MATLVSSLRSLNGQDTPPYKALDKDYLAQQLPHLQEKAPKPIQEPLEISSNAPSSLPSPSLYPGEVLLMRQHRMVCMNAFAEPAVGLIFLTNFRLIFYGSLISDPDVMEILREIQYHPKKESTDILQFSPHLLRKAPPPIPTRSSRFYIGEEDKQEEEMEERTTFSNKMIQRLGTIKRSGAGIKTAITDLSSRSRNKPRSESTRPAISSPQPLLPHSQTSPRPLTKSTDDILATCSASVPNKECPTPKGSSSNSSTLPRAMPSHHIISNSSISRTNDSGFVDPSHNSLLDSASQDGLNSSQSVGVVSSKESLSLSPEPPMTPEPLSPPSSDEIDFEKAPPLIKPRTCRNPHYKRPDSILGVDSDSDDSDTTSNKYFANILEDDFTSDDDDGLLSPDSIAEEPEYINVTRDDSLSPAPTKPRQGPPGPPVIAKPRAISIPNPSSTPPPKTKPRPAKPPRRKKFSLEHEPVTIVTSLPALPLSEEHKSSTGITPTRTNSDGVIEPRRRPPPPPPVSSKSSLSLSATIVTRDKQPLAKDDSNGSITPKTPSTFSDDDGILPPDDDKDKRSSSLLVNRSLTGDSNMRRLTISSPRDPPYAFDWSSQHNGGGGANTWSGHLNTQSQSYSNYSVSVSIPLLLVHSIKHLPSTLIEDFGIRIADGVLVLGKNFSSLKIHSHPQNTFDATKLKELLELQLDMKKPAYESFAFKYRSAIRIPDPRILDSHKLSNFYSFDVEIGRIGILESKLHNSQLWRETTITKDDPRLCSSYPDKLVVLTCTPDIDLKRGAVNYQQGRFPTACWMNRSNSAVLLRSSATISERGVQGSKLSVDEAILQAIRKCNKNSLLYVFTEKAESTGFQDPNKLTQEAACSYYYHNCSFVYTINPPSFKSVRHSFNKLQAMLLNNVSEDEYLVALDSTRWLNRISMLLETTCHVCRVLCEEGAHVLVSYEDGWDRTTQVVSLAQLLCDPYYRTMDGFQVLIQKEWLWFGHPFQSRHVRQNNKTKNDGPVFLQWMDCVWQVMRQYPFAFEFNENLLMAIVEHSYSGQFGTFLLNTEKERNQSFMVADHYHQSVHGNTVSLWMWVTMMNASTKIFYNPLYDESFHTGTIYPNHYQACLELWHSHYSKENLRIEINEGLVDSRIHIEMKQLIRLYQERFRLSDEVIECPISKTSPITLQGGTRFMDNDSVVPHGTGPTRTRSVRVYNSITEYLSAEGYDASVCHHVVLSSTLCQGYLIKEGGFLKNWKKRWFVLDFKNAYLAYFESEEHFGQNERPKGVITLDKIKKVSLSTRRVHLMSNLFQVITLGRTYNIKAPSIITMEIWMACLRLHPSALNHAVS